MTTWILILTMFGASQAGMDIHSIEFSSKERCIAAGSNWLAKTGDKYPTFRALCVQK